MILVEKFLEKYAALFSYGLAPLRSHSAIAPFDSSNTGYAIRSLHFAFPNLLRYALQLLISAKG